MESVVTIGLVLVIIAIAVAYFGVPDDKWKRRHDRSQDPWTD
jgi:hypothetical protein